MNTTPFFTKNVIGFVSVTLVIYAVVIIGLFFLAYSPKVTELEIANRDRAAALEDAVDARRRLAELEEELAAERAQIADLESLLAEARETSAVLEARIRERESEIEAAQQMQLQLSESLQREIAAGQIHVERMLDSLRVDLVNEILFDSGEATLKPEGGDLLSRLGEILHSATDKLIIVQGHADSVQITGRLAQRFPTNWELSAARAVNVTRYLQEQVGIEPQRLSAAGFSEYRPREDNSTPEGRQRNRRIEILLAPLPETSFGQPVPSMDAD